MADYKRMYALLCAAADEAIDALEEIPGTEQVLAALQAALLEAEDLYIETSEG